MTEATRYLILLRSKNRWSDALKTKQFTISSLPSDLSSNGVPCYSIISRSLFRYNPGAKRSVSSDFPLADSRLLLSATSTSRPATRKMRIYCKLVNWKITEWKRFFSDEPHNDRVERVTRSKTINHNC